ncbi:PREDICTED: uncharacterized protein LOC104798667 isoform X1 [Tarenaya hassleriana]|uniref:uncharacterized protein LOC104798667 isoform X1 n=1 Tax=Tarenaya hassleriana TaxID=28532 RepID=UPI00053C2E2B|nr:PREDICTED: uncharacterized protein LOC104798667 isoform X1 [Tarenaya hassleriana]
MPMRQFSPQLHHHFSNRATHHQFVSQLPPPPSLSTVLLFTSYSTASSLPRRRFNLRKRHPPPAEALVPTVIVEEAGGDDDIGESDAKKSRNLRKREARRAVRWGMELASFSNDQIKRILRAASLEEDVYDALMLAKRLGPDVREGKRRQFNYIGKLLREVEPDLMDTLIHATKNGDQRTLQALVSSAKNNMDDVGGENDDVETDSEDEVEWSDEYISVAARWFDGLISQNVKVTNEVYLLQSVDFDRQELRKLVRNLRLAQERRKSVTEETEKKISAAVVAAEKSLTRFLYSLAKQVQGGQSDSYL